MSSQPVPAAPVPALGPTATLLLLLVAVDFLLIALHVLHVWSPWFENGKQYSMESYNGLASIYQYIKQVWLAGCLALAFLQTRSKVFFGWTLLFAFLLLDDALELHEQFGAVLAAALSFPAVLGMRPADLGEISIAAAIGCVALALVAITFRHGAKESRELSADLMCLLAALALFGVFFDMLHTITYFNAPSFSEFFALIEDGGEMLVISAITAYAFDLTNNGGRPRIGIWTRLSSALSSR
jgi:hypothetical protein